MTLSSDLRSYADTAVNQGKQVLDQAIDQAQASFTDVAGSANHVVGRARDNVADLRASAEKVVNIDAVSTALEPYVAQLREYSTAVTDRVEHAVDGLRSDKRVAKIFDQAEALGSTVVVTITERVVKPVQSLTGRGTTATSSRSTTRKATPKPRAAKSANTRPATKSAPRKTASTRSATKPATKTARKSAAKGTSAG